MPELSNEWVYFALINGVPAAFAAVLFLVYPPFQKRFAWDVAPRESGIFFSASFLLRAGLFAHIILASTWGEIRWLVWGNTVYAAVLLAVTMIWGDMFKWRRSIAIIWLFLYIEEPIWMISLVPDARAAWAGMGPLSGGELSALLQAVLWVETAVMLVAGLYLLFLNRVSEPMWPWRPDSISHRMMAGFALAWAAWAPTLARAESWGEAKVGVLLNLVWLGALLALLLVFRSRFDLSRRPTQVYGGVIAGLFILLAISYLIQG